MSVRFFLKDVHSFVSDVYSYFNESMGDNDGSGGKSIPEAFICKCVDLLLVRLILNNLRQEKRCNFYFVSVWN